MADRPAHQSVAQRGQQKVDAMRVWAADSVDRHRRLGLVDVLVRLYERDRLTAGFIVSSAIAFRLFLFCVPFLLFVVGLVGFFGPVIGRGDLDDAGIGSALARQIDVALTQPGSARWTATVVGLVGLAAAGRPLSRALVQTSCLAWSLPVRSRSSLRLTGGVIGLLVGMGAVTALVNLLRHRLGMAAAGLSFLPATGLYTAAWFVLSTRLPRPMTDPGPLLPGALLVAVTLAALQSVSQLFLPDRISRASHLYGALGVTTVTLGWFFVLGRIIVLSMALDAVVHDRFGSISRTVFALPLVRRLPPRSSWIRQKFELGDGDGDPS